MGRRKTLDGGYLLYSKAIDGKQGGEVQIANRIKRDYLYLGMIGLSLYSRASIIWLYMKLSLKVLSLQLIAVSKAGVDKLAMKVFIPYLRETER
jgi:hypothetical protein